MSKDLFREEVNTQQGERLWGELILSQATSYWVISVFIATTSLLAIYFLLINDYQRKQLVTGHLVPDKGMIEIAPPRSGVLTNMFVSPQGKVNKGDVLFSMQAEQIASREGILSEQMLNNLNEQKRTLFHRIELAKLGLVNKTQQFNNKQRRLQEQVEQLTALMSNERVLNALKAKSLERAAVLQTKGLLSTADYDQVNAVYLTQNSAMHNLAIRLSDTKAALVNLNSEKNNQRLNSQHQISLTETSVEELNKQIARVKAENHNEIFAPVTGQVSNVIGQVGQSINPQQTIVAIIPQNSTIEAELFVPTRAIAFIKHNQKVLLRYAAFPYQKFGLHNASISNISSSSINPDDVPKNLPFNEPVYRITATLENQTVTAYGNEVSLLPGMLLSADVILESRSLFEWLLEPLFSIKGKW